MKNRGERIAYIRKTLLGFRNQTDFAKFLGGDLTRGAVGNWELNEPISRENLLNIANKSGVSAEWIESGIGEVPLKNQNSSIKNDIVDGNGDQIQSPSNGIKEIDSCAGLGGGQTMPDNYRKSQHGYTPVDAFKSEAWVFPNRFMQSGFKASSNDILAITTQGESMSPTINHGDVVFVDTTHKKVSPSGLYALRDVYGEMIVKRLNIFLRDGQPFIRITSDNPHEPSRDESASEVTVIGRICGIMKLV